MAVRRRRRMRHCRIGNSIIWWDTNKRWTCWNPFKNDICRRDMIMDPICIDAFRKQWAMYDAILFDSIPSSISPQYSNKNKNDQIISVVTSNNHMVTLEETDAVLEVYDQGPWVCGDFVSAADVVWAPFWNVICGSIDWFVDTTHDTPRNIMPLALGSTPSNVTSPAVSQAMPPPGPTSYKPILSHYTTTKETEPTNGTPFPNL
eukprot:scaffold58726_cov58-Attheya_sp.AAC.2